MQHVEDMAESERAGALLELSQSLREKADDLLRLVDGSSSSVYGTRSPLPPRHSQHESSAHRADGEFETLIIYPPYIIYGLSSRKIGGFTHLRY